MKSRFPLVVAVGLIRAVSGCAADDDADHDMSCDQPAVIVEANKTEIASGEDVTLTVITANFMLVDPDEAHDPDGFRPDETEFRDGYEGACMGHYHVYLDDLMTNPLTMSWAQQVTVTVDADPGEHDLIVRLNDNEHKIIEPQVSDSVTLTVQ